MKGVEFNCQAKNSDGIIFDRIEVCGGILYIQTREDDAYATVELNAEQVQNLKDFLNENF